MYGYLLLVGIWTISLTILRQKPESLRVRPIPYTTNLLQSKTTLLLGLLFICIYAITAGYEGIALDAVFALNNQMSFSGFTILQFFTNIFIHFSFIHLLSNLSFLGLLSIYEKRVGAVRYLKIFFVSALVANISILFYSEPILSAGASGGIAGLAAAYLLDHSNITLRQYWIGFISALVVFIALQLETFFDAKEIGMNIDFLGHFFGFITGAIIVRIFPK
jgi:membrane associated rhomboid family serine protease